LNITKVKSTGKNSYQVKGDLKIKGISKSIDFQVSIYGNKASANLKVDRTDFGIKYGSGSYFEDLQDKMIYDEFDLNIDLEF
jgi:polyisoprenoid-binding protein YceI